MLNANSNPKFSGATTIRGLAVGGRLVAIHLGVVTSPGHERLVRSTFHDSGPIELDDQVRHTHRREAV